MQPSVITHPLLKPLAMAVKVTVFSSALLPLFVMPSLALADNRTSESMMQFDIPSGALDEALNQFGVQTGINVLADGQLTEGKRSDGLKGSYRMHEAFEALLAGTGLTYQVDEEGNYTLKKDRRQSFGEATQIGVVTVKSELQERSLQDSQASAVVYSGEELDQSTDVDLYDVINRTPGVYYSPGKKLSIRGISDVGASNITVDGISLPNSSFSRTDINGPYSTWDLEQIEILRGPQSTQTGRNSLAGTINVRTANPTFERETKLRADYGTHNSYGLALAHNQPLVDDVLAVRVAAETNKSDGWIENKTRDEKNYDEKELSSARIKVLYRPVEKLEAVLGFSYTENNDPNSEVDYADWPDDNNSYYDVEAIRKTNTKLLHLDLNYQVSNRWKITSKTGGYMGDYYAVDDYDRSALDGGKNDRDGDSQSFSQELKASYDSEDLRGVFGVYYTKATHDMDSSLLGINYLGGAKVDVLYGNVQEVENKSIFAEFDYDLSKRVTFTFGARYDQEQADIKNKKS